MNYYKLLQVSFVGLLSTLSFNSTTLNAAAAAIEMPTLPEVAQDTNVHTISRTYCKPLWQSVKSGAAGEYISKDSDEFVAEFESAVSGLSDIIARIEAGSPILISGVVPDPTLMVDELDAETRRTAIYFDSGAKTNLKLALSSLSVLGKHKGGSEFDAETQAFMNEVFVYTWKKAMENPADSLELLLMGLYDAAPTCIQGYSVRMLCAVHPPKHKGVEGK